MKITDYILNLSTDKIKWCYLGKLNKSPENNQHKIHKDTQNINKTETPKSSSFTTKGPNQPFDPISLADTHQRYKLNHIY